MNSLAAYNQLMTHTVSLRKRDRNESGDFSDLSSSSIAGFVEYGNKLVTNFKGEEVTAKAIIFLKYDCGIDPDWTYWMIDQTAPYSRTNMEVINIYPIDDPRTGKTHHFEIAVR